MRWGAWGHRVRRLAVPVVLAAAGLAACSAPRPDTSLCVGAQIDSIAAIAERLTIDGVLRHGRVYERTPSEQFISAELLPDGEDEDHDGDILTWFTADAESAEFVAVDEHAREKTSWPAASFDVREDGAIESRGCVLHVRGEPADSDCQAGFEQFC